ncbi:MAG: hypothetical protein ABR521_07570 [Gaiellaceae bacterium]
MRRALAAALVALAVAAGAGAASQAEPPVPGAEFTDDAGGDFYVMSDASEDWDLRGSAARPKVVEWIVKPRPRDTDPYRRQGVAALWAPTCARGRQTVHFRRSFFLAGPENSLGALVEPIIRGRGGFESLELRVNGLPVLKTKGATGQFDPTEKNLKRLRFGRNTIDVIAVKRASDRGVRCNVSKATNFGVAFWINGEFGSDTGLLEPPSGDAKRNVAGQSRVLETITFEVRNNGPGGAAGMGLVVQLGIPQKPGETFVLVEPRTGGRVNGCNVGSYVNDPFQPVISCRIVNLKAGGRVQIPIRIGFFLPDRPFRQVVMTMAWQVSQGGEEVGNTKNNRREAKIYYCDPDATDSKCS